MWQWKSTFLPLSNLCLFKFFFSTNIPTSLSCTAMCIHRRGHFPWRADTNPCGPSNSHFGASIVRWASYYKKCPYEAGTLSGRYSREVVFFDPLKRYLSLQLGHYCNDKWCRSTSVGSALSFVVRCPAFAILVASKKAQKNRKESKMSSYTVISLIVPPFWTFKSYSIKPTHSNLQPSPPPNFHDLFC